MNKHILFIAPFFYNYEKEILDEILAQGYKVSYVFYSSGSFFLTWKIRRLEKQLELEKKQISHLIKMHHFDLLLVIKGEILQKDIIDEFKKKNPGSLTINYQWDSIHNSPVSIDILNSFDIKYTFDHLDVLNEAVPGLQLKPLFFSKAFNQNPTIRECYDIATVGGMQLHRVKLIKLLMKKFPQLRYKILLRTFITLNLPANLFKVGIASYFRFLLLRDLSHQKVAEVLKKSKVVIDIPHNAQSGLSMRTIEVLGLGKKIITTNANIQQYDFYHPANVFILDNSNFDGILNFISSSGVPIKREITEKYALKRWVSSIINNKYERYLHNQFKSHSI